MYADEGPLTIEQAWGFYEEQEQELWDEYAEVRTYVAGRMYVAGERLCRKRLERALQRLRWQRFDAPVAA